MALLRHQSFPSTQQLHSLTPQQFSLPPATTSTSLRSPPSLSLSSSSFSHLPPIKTRRAGLFLFHVSSASEALSTTVETSELQNSTTVEQVQEEEEVDESSRTNLVARNVPFTSTADDLRPLFEKYGTVLNIRFWMYDETRNRGTAFITMSSHEEAVAAMANRDSFELDGRVINLDWEDPKNRKKSPPKVHNLFVTNLSFAARPKDLLKFFNADKGNVVSKQIMVDEGGRSKGFGFVSFNTREEAEEAISAFQGKIFMGRKIWVEHALKLK